MWKIIERLLAVERPDKMTPGQKTGLWGEREAERHLKAKGHKILARRLRIGRRDEIDLLARDGDTLVFIEVKTRAGEDYGRPFSAVDRGKRFNLARAAARYLSRMRPPPPSFRFDVVEIIGKKDQPNPIIRHIENAFPLPRHLRAP